MNKNKFAPLSKNEMEKIQGGKTEYSTQSEPPIPR